MSVSRLTHITPIGVEQMGDLADSLQDPEVLRLENLDTDLRPPQVALQVTKQAVDDDNANSYLPFFGLDIMRQAAAGNRYVRFVFANEPVERLRGIGARAKHALT